MIEEMRKLTKSYLSESCVISGDHSTELTFKIYNYLLDNDSIQGEYRADEEGFIALTDFTEKTYQEIEKAIKKHCLLGRKKQVRPMIESCLTYIFFHVVNNQNLDTERKIEEKKRIKAEKESLNKAKKKEKLRIEAEEIERERLELERVKKSEALQKILMKIDEL